ncbi:DUF748 domain-containing protein [Aquimarina algiphila]|uniref:DUF748 domain-containing protein n=2 Tax=Aquimarina algiphila TaxID=2047982 RepID=A0A554VLU9_9FLAO|nr:DUF748 domain-containing protein [Aquimarina algiphila]TSE09150.1 DUF748 domain-containing protein [Aquimarina algiphila]
MKETKKRSLYKNKRFVIPVLITMILIIGRLLLPYYVKKYVNNVLADIPGYYGQVTDIDISLLRGAYVIDGLYLNKIDVGSQVSFLDFEKTDISIEWRSIFKGKIVSEIILTRPKFTYIFEDHKKNNLEDPELNDWTKALTDLVPIDINRLEVINGKAAFVQLSANPNIDLHLDQIDLEAKNLRNIARTDKELPSSVKATAVSIGGGTVKLNGKMDLVKTIPDIDISFSLEEAKVTSLNDFTNHYAGIDFNNGEYSVYSEVAIADGFLKGYVKPMLTDARLIGREDGFLDTLWEGFVGFFKFALKNHKTNTLATKVPLEGDLNTVESNIWVAIFNIFENAWIKAFKGMTDNSVNFEDAKKAADKAK